MGKIISVLNLKGGVGKTTLATNLAVAFALDKKKVLLLDTDKSAAALAWSGRRTDGLADVRVMQITDPQSLQKQISGICEEYEIIIIDGTPHLELMSQTTAIISDVILIPLQPSAFDLMVSITFIEKVKELMILNPKINACVVINNGKAETRIIKEIELAIKEYEFPLLKTEVHNLVCFAEAATAGLSVLELPLSKKTRHAMNEIQLLYNEIKKRSR